MNRTEVFATVKGHLLEQNAQASDFAGCQYLTKGLRCAVGCLIPSGHPGLGYRGRVSDLLEYHPDLKKLWEVETDVDISFLEDLQNIHDYNDPGSWPRQLDTFEKEWING